MYLTGIHAHLLFALYQKCNKAIRKIDGSGKMIYSHLSWLDVIKTLVCKFSTCKYGKRFYISYSFVTKVSDLSWLHKLLISYAGLVISGRMLCWICQVKLYNGLYLLPVGSPKHLELIYDNRSSNLTYFTANW